MNIVLDISTNEGIWNATIISQEVFTMLRNMESSL